MRIFQREPKLPLLPLRNLVLFPGAEAWIDVGRPASKRAVEAALAEGKRLFLATQQDPGVDRPGLADFYPMGLVAEIRRVSRVADGTLRILARGLERGRLLDLEEGEATLARYRPVPEPRVRDPEAVRALTERVREAFERYLAGHKSLRLDRDQQREVLAEPDPARLADRVAAIATWSPEEKAAILAEEALEPRLERVLALLLRDLERFELDRKIAARVKEQMDKNQREYYLREQMRAIQKELGGGEDHLTEVEELKERIQKKGFPKEVEEKALKELARYERLQPGSPEAGVVRTYLDWLLDLPWSERSEDVFDLERTREKLDADHYALEEVKERILEFLAAKKLGGEEGAKGPILCLVGPPGVGKTSLGRSIAESMQRRFVRVSLGGVRDEAEIRGHRRTYIGSMPGKIIQSMKKAKTSNPLFMLDEIDKLGADFRGDPSSALLEVLDPEQNAHFNDHYLEVDYDLSDVMFVCTANTLRMPQPLMDRMEIIRIPGYTEDEKLEIAKRHLIPKQRKAHGLSESEWQITDEALLDLVRYYTREAGVRNLEREIANLARKAVKQIVGGEKTRIKITRRNLEKYAGVRKYRFGEAEHEDLVGLTTGLAWTEFGGELLSVEAVVVPGKGKMTITGKLGDVMQESVQAARSYVRARAVELGIDPGLFEKVDIHIHVPEGAIPKDGPSAGVAMVTSIVSALTQIPVRASVAMTGEITLRGRVLAIGGLKEKLLAALRGGIKTVLIPRDNEKDLAEIPDNVKKALEIVPVATVDEVLTRALVRQPQPLPAEAMDETVAVPPPGRGEGEKPGVLPN